MPADETLRRLDYYEPERCLNCGDRINGPAGPAHPNGGVFCSRFCADAYDADGTMRAEPEGTTS